MPKMSRVFSFQFALRMFVFVVVFVVVVVVSLFYPFEFYKTEHVIKFHVFFDGRRLQSGSKNLDFLLFDAKGKGARMSQEVSKKITKNDLHPVHRCTETVNHQPLNGPCFFS